jgi:hypothetical protein
MMECLCSFLRRPLAHHHAACCPAGQRQYARTVDGHWHTRAGGELGWTSPRCIHCHLPLAIAYVPMTAAMVVLLRAWYALTAFPTGKPARKAVVAAMLELLGREPDTSRVEHWEAWT